LFDLKNDPAEKHNVAKSNSEVIKRMEALAVNAIYTLGNDNIQGSEQRDALTLESSKPMLLKK
jgi:hypothetical protein